MKGLVTLLGLVAVACAASPTNSFDAVDVNQYDDIAQLKILVNCIAGLGPCTPLESTLKERLKGIVATNCGDCSLRERDIIVLLTNRIARVNKDDMFNLLKICDPTEKHFKIYLKYLNNVSDERGLPKLSDDIINSLPDIN